MPKMSLYPKIVSESDNKIYNSQKRCGYILECLCCSKHFYRKKSQVKENRGSFCSKKCVNSFRKDKFVADTVTVSCKRCNKDIKLLRSEHLRNPREYCSISCRNKSVIKIGNEHWNWKQVERECLNCNKRFYYHKCHLDRKTGDGKYCSRSCRTEYWIKNGTFSLQNNPAWKGGVTPLVNQIRRCHQYKDWRNAVFTRDDFTCVFCNTRGGWIEADHYPKMFSEIFYENSIETIKQAQENGEFWDINNGRTLCKKCHNSCHSKCKTIVIDNRDYDVGEQLELF